MIDEQDLKLTDLDYLTGSHHLQMMKAALPYMEVPEQRLMSVFVKFNELQRTISLFQDEEVAALGICSLEEKKSPMDMLKAIKPFGNTMEQDFIDLISNFMMGSRMANAYQESMDNPDTISAQNTHTGNTESVNSFAKRIPLEQLKGFLSPEQQSRMETMQMLIQTMQQFT